MEKNMLERIISYIGIGCMCANVLLFSFKGRKEYDLRYMKTFVKVANQEIYLNPGGTIWGKARELGINPGDTPEYYALKDLLERKLKQRRYYLEHLTNKKSNKN